mgnify:CR=1 FL=1
MKTEPYPHGETIIMVCTDCKCKKILKAVKQEVRSQGVRKGVRVQKCDCLGACKEGPNVLVSNGKAVLFSGMKPDDAKALVAYAGSCHGPGDKD